MSPCTTDKCPQILDSSCVFYEGSNLIFSGINTNDSVEVVIQKLNLKLESIPIFNSNNYYNKTEINNIIKGYIPLSGTLVNYPVTGNIEFSPGEGIKLYSNDSFVMLDDGSVNINGNYITISSINDNNSVLINNNQVFLNSGNSNNRKFINFSQELNYIVLESNFNGAGLVGTQYYGNNYVDTSFVQKKFVLDTFNNIDLSNYYTKSQTYTKNEVDYLFDLKADLSQLNNFYTKSETFSQNQINTALGLKLDKGGYTGTAQDLYNRLEGKITAGTNNIPRIGNGASGYILENSVITQINNNIGIGLSGEATEKLEVNGNVKANSYKFNLPSSLAAQANTLIPKVDGTRPIWYDNSSVANDLAFKSDIDNLTNSKLDKPLSPDNISTRVINADNSTSDKGEFQQSEQIEINTSQPAQASWRGKEVWVTASCTLTIPDPATLPPFWSIDVYVYAGTLTFAITSPGSWIGTAPANAPADSFFRIVRHGNTNSFKILGL